MNTKCSKKILSTTAVATILLLFAFSVMCTPVSAATEAEIEQAIDDGIVWLVAQQNPDGSWGTSDTVAMTGLAVKKLEHHAVDCKYGYCLDSPLDPAYPYADNVQNGLDYLFDQSNIIGIGPQTHGNPDTDSDGIGVYFVNGTAHHRNYETGIALMAIAESTTPDRVVDVPGSAVNGWTYYEVAVDTMNYLAWAQADAGTSRGGWGYAQCNNGSWWMSGDRSDNSNSGWVVLGLQYAETEDPLHGFNIPIPQSVKDELNLWIDYIQCNPGDPGWTAASDGGSGYTAPCVWVNILKTGNLLKEMAFVGDTKDTPRVIRADDYICRHWDDPNNDPGWRPNNYHAMYTTMKGFVSLDIHETCGHDWQADFEDAIVTQQNDDGSWSGCIWGDDILCTEWALLTLQKVVPLQMTPGKVTGGGQIEAPVQTGGKKVDKASFGFNVMYQETDPAPKGELEYLDHATGMNVHAHDMTRLVVSDDKTKAWFEGTCTIDGVSGYTFEAYVEDNGEPGKNDVFEITLSTGYTTGGELLSGNIQIHKKP